MQRKSKKLHPDFIKLGDLGINNSSYKNSKNGS